jgi:membrane protein implicated in regulation of membrane protease activity
MKIFLRIAGIIIAVLSLLLLFAVPVAGVIFLIIGALFIFLSIKLPQKKELPKIQSAAEEEEAPFSGSRTREAYYMKEDGRVSDIAKLCIDKPDGGAEVVYVREAWLSNNVENMKVQEKQVFETVAEAKEHLKDMSYKPIKDNEHMEKLGLSEYAEWLYK